MVTTLIQISEALKKGEAVPVKGRTTVRTLLKMFDSKRRGTQVVQTIQEQLEASGLATVPPITEAYSVDSPIQFVLMQGRSKSPVNGVKLASPTTPTETPEHTLGPLDITQLETLIRSIITKSQEPEPSTVDLTFQVSSELLDRWKSLQDTLPTMKPAEVFGAMLDLFTIREHLVRKGPTQVEAPSAVRRRA